MLVKSRDDQSLSRCGEPGHLELFQAVVKATRARSGARQRQAERVDELAALYEDHLQALERSASKS